MAWMGTQIPILRLEAAPIQLMKPNRGGRLISEVFMLLKTSQYIVETATQVSNIVTLYPRRNATIRR